MACAGLGVRYGENALSGAHFFGGVHHRSNDLVVTRTTTQIAGKPIAHFSFGGIRIVFEQGSGGNQEARCADTALQCRMFQELTLQWMQLVALGHALDGIDASAFNFRAEHQARADQPAVQSDAARATIPRAAAFLAARQVELVTQHVE